MDLSVVIVSYNTKKLLKDCLESIFKYTQGLKFEVWVVDNASTDGSVELIQKSKIKYQNEKSKFKIIANKKNLGFAAANNQALKRAQGEYCLLLNSDTIIKSNVFKKLYVFAKSHPKAGVIGPKLLFKDGNPQPSIAPFFTLPKVFLWLFSGDRFLYASPLETKQVDWVMGSAFLVNQKVFEKAGWLDENFFMYVEEQEWCYRIKKAGWQIWFYPGAAVYHLVRGSSPEGKQRAIWWIFKGLIYYYRKHFASWQLSVLKFLLQFKAGIAWFLGLVSGNSYLKETYAKAYWLVKRLETQDS